MAGWKARKASGGRETQRVKEWDGVRERELSMREEAKGKGAEWKLIDREYRERRVKEPERKPMEGRRDGLVS